MSDEAADRSQAWLAGLTSLILLGGLGILIGAFLRDRRQVPLPPPRIPSASAAPASRFSGIPAPLPPRPTSAPPATAGSRTVATDPKAAPADDLVSGTNWDAFASVMLKYSIGAKSPGSMPPMAASILGEGYARLDRIARKVGLPDAQAALYLPEVRERLCVSLLGASGVTLSPQQEDQIRKFNQEEYGESWRKEAFALAAPPLARGLKVLESQDRYERFLKTQLKPEQQGAYLAALGEDPLRNERIPVETLKAPAPDRAQAVAEHWDQVFDHAVPPEALRGRAADLVRRMDELRGGYEGREGRPLSAESERAVRRGLLKLQVEAEAMVCPAPSAGSPRALRMSP